MEEKCNIHCVTTYQSFIEKNNMDLLEIIKRSMEFVKSQLIQEGYTEYEFGYPVLVEKIGTGEEEKVKITFTLNY